MEKVDSVQKPLFWKKELAPLRRGIHLKWRDVCFSSSSATNRKSPFPSLVWLPYLSREQYAYTQKIFPLCLPLGTTLHFALGHPSSSSRHSARYAQLFVTRLPRVQNLSLLLLNSNISICFCSLPSEEKRSQNHHWGQLRDSPGWGAEKTHRNTLPSGPFTLSWCSLLTSVDAERRPVVRMAPWAISVNLDLSGARLALGTDPKNQDKWRFSSQQSQSTQSEHGIIYIYMSIQQIS